MFPKNYLDDKAFNTFKHMFEVARTSSWVCDTLQWICGRDIDESCIDWIVWRLFAIRLTSGKDIIKCIMESVIENTMICL